MKQYKCSSCGISGYFFTKKVGNSTGLYCGECGKWLKWLSKEELRLIENRMSMIPDKIPVELDNNIQCAACGFAGSERVWFNSSLHSKIKICPKCGILRFLHPDNAGYRK